MNSRVDLSYSARPAKNPDPPVQAGYRSILISRSGTPRFKDLDRYQIGDRIGDRYEVLAIHRGGMGVVYATLDHRTKLRRALKSLQIVYSPGNITCDLFTEEASIWVKLGNHPCIVRAFRVTYIDWQMFVIADYIRGPESMGSDLRAWLGHPRLTLPVAMKMAWEIAMGMKHAVQVIPGLVHRDVKPSNILVDEQGRAMVTDFGLAGSWEPGAGTPAYMAPEQWEEAKLDQRTDIYAYGCVLYEMVTGHRMFGAAGIQEWAMAHLYQRPIPPTQLADIPPGIEEFVFRCLEKKPAARPNGWDEVVSACGEWYQRLTGRPAILEFDPGSAAESELIDACESLGATGNHEDMLKLSDRLIAEFPDSRDTMLHRVDLLQHEERTPESRALLDRVLVMFPNDAAAWVKNGALLHRGAYSNKNPEQTRALCERGLAAYDRAVSIDPSNCDAWIGKARVFRGLEQKEELWAAIDRAIAINPRSDAWIMRFDVLIDQERWEDAVAAADRALAIFPANFFCWRDKARVLLKLGRAEEALAASERALALDPTLSGARLLLAEALVALERWWEALQPARVAMYRNSGWRPKYLVSLVCRRLGLYKEALEVLERAIKENPQNFEPWVEKGITLEILNLLDEGLAAYDRALALDPKAESALSGREALKKRIAGSKPADIHQWLDLTTQEARLGKKVRVTISERQQEIVVTIPAGVKDGTRLRCPGKGRAARDGSPDGDLYLVLRVK
jgi:serine/threonine-protein kinase